MMSSTGNCGFLGFDRTGFPRDGGVASSLNSAEKFQGIPTSLKGRAAKVEGNTEAFWNGALKIDLVARVILAVALVSIFGFFWGVAGASLSYAAEKIIGWFASKTIRQHRPSTSASSLAMHITADKTPFESVVQDSEVFPLALKSVDLRFPPTSVSSFQSSVAVLPKKAPVGIWNEGNTCFIASAIQLILKDPILREALIEERKNEGGLQKFGEFLFNYREKQQDEKNHFLSGVRSLREAMVSISKNQKYSGGQWDANEVVGVILGSTSTSFQQQLSKKGYFLQESVRRYYQIPDGYKPASENELNFDPKIALHYRETTTEKPGLVGISLFFEESRSLTELLGSFFSQQNLEGSEPSIYHLMKNSGGAVTPELCSVKFAQTSWDRIPDLIRVNLDRSRYDGRTVKISDSIEIEDSIKLAVGEGSATFRLVGFTRHSGTAQGGHWVSYTAENECYYKNSDEIITLISKADFFREAQAGSDFLLEKIES